MASTTPSTSRLGMTLVYRLPGPSQDQVRLPNGLQGGREGGGPLREQCHTGRCGSPALS